MLARIRRESCKDNGFTLIELIVVFSIMGVLAAILVPSVGRQIESTRKKVCSWNRLEVERMYEIYLVSGDVEPSKEVFEQYVEEYEIDICPGKGKVGYHDGKINCSVHLEEVDERNNDEEDVPYL